VVRRVSSVLRSRKSRYWSKLHYRCDVISGSKISRYIVLFLPAFCSGMSFFFNDCSVIECKMVHKELKMQSS